MKISPFLWFDTQAEQAAKFYTEIFKNSKITATTHYGENMPMPKGTVMTVGFEIDGQKFTALNGGSHYKINEAISFVVDCKDQQEVDYYWEGLLAGGGTAIQCGWLKDQFGVAWQVVPTILPELMADKDPAKAQRVAQAMMKMVKLEIKTLQDAAHSEKHS